MAKKNRFGRFEERIGETDFEFSLWGASDAYRTYNKLAAIIGVPAMAVFGGATGKQDVLGMLADHLLSRGEEGLEMLKKLSASEGGVGAFVSKASGDRPPDVKLIEFDSFYEGRLELAIDVAIANYKIQFPSLTQSLQKKLNSALRQKTNSDSPPITGRDAE